MARYGAHNVVLAMRPVQLSLLISRGFLLSVGSQMRSMDYVALSRNVKLLDCGDEAISGMCRYRERSRRDEST